ncbi:uncharacterized protein LOC121368777 [Gigantopelta aegis]|uniref:uncharacterized protein LOC121368777 n=1 Tax=Gigantopelta aegis TaxID=1735272 RepID=UPI001B88B90F|nr:uncharacterized protein LOC121368777 [Gigantopelta aegis]
MGITDIDLVFDHLDTSKRGYVTPPQISELLSSIYVSNIPVSHIEAAIKQICGSDGRVAKGQFIDILVEIERRQAVEEQAYWDFQALDYNGDHRINLKDALMLFQEFHGENFSLETWHRFLDSRDYSDIDVYFDEIRSWLCDAPIPGSSPPHLVKEEETRLDELVMNNTEKELTCLKDIQKQSGADEEDEREMEDIRFHARRRLNKWNKQGVEAMLYDDGLDVEQEEVKQVKVRDSISMALVMEALDIKYSQIQDKLLMVMAKFAAVVEGEYAEIFQELKQQLRRIRPQSLNGEVWNMPGSQAVLPSSLRAMMGELPEVNHTRFQRVTQWKTSLQAEGKSQREVDDIVRQDYESFIEGSGTCGNLLICLRERHKEEKLAIMDRLRGQTVTMIALATERVHLEHQLFLLDEEEEFYTAAVAVGLAERSPPVRCQGYAWDRVRSEELAGQRLSTRKGHKPVKSSKTLDKDSGKGQGLLDLQLRVVAEVERKQFYEREAFIYMLQGHETNAAIMSAEKQSTNERHRRKIMLRNQHISWRESVRMESHTAADDTNHLSRLQDAVAIHWVEQQAKAEKNFTIVGDADLAAVILADLQETQEQEFAAKLKEIVKKTPDDLSTMLRREAKARILEFFDNIATVVLGVAEISEAEREYVDALKEKYQVLKDQIFVFALKDKFGGEWERMTSEEKEREILKLRKEEKVLRGEGKLEEMASLIGPRAQALPSLVFMLGESKKYSLSEESGSLESNRPGINILADLGARYDVEEDSLLLWLRTPTVQSMAGTRRRLTLLKIQLEKHTGKTEQNFEVAFISLGLVERLHKNRYNRQDADIERQNRLAAKRVTLRRRKLDQHENTDKTFKQNPKPSGDLYDQRLACVMEVQQLHDEERELLLNFLQDDSFADLIEAADMMSHEERQLRLCELSGKREKLNLDNQDDQDEYQSILEEAAAVQFVCKKVSLKSPSALSVPVDDIASAILSDLQHSQDCRLHDILQELGNHSEEELQHLWVKESHDRQIKLVNNVFDVLTAYEGVGGEKDLLQIVDEKYSALRDRLLLESLRQNHGDVTMSSKQMKPMQQQGLSYWNENNQTGLVDLLGADFKPTDSIVSLMGVNRREWAQWLMDQKGCDTVLQEKESSEVTAELIIGELFDRFNSEKTFIKDTLKGSYGRIMTPNDREVLLSRLNREVTLVGKCEKFKMAAIHAGLLERQTIAKNCCLAGDRSRYSTLAENEWAELMSGNKPAKSKTSVEVVQSSERLLLQNNILALLNSLHQGERQLLLNFLDSKKDVSDIQNIARIISEQERSDQLMMLKNQRNKLQTDNVKENAAILEEAAVIKREWRRSRLCRGDQSTDEVTDIDAGVSLLADLLQQQNSDAELHLRKFLTQTLDDLANMQTMIKLNLENSRCENLATILFSPEEPGLEAADELVEAVEGKYNALNDKLLTEALINQIGQREWCDLSERERQRRLVMLKLKQKQLLQDGKYDEAAALLGDVLNTEKTLRKLMGDSQADYERKLKERLEKRKQRLDKGLSEEDCDILEQEDRQKEEEEESKEKKNILLELDTRLAQEKDSILNQMKLAEDEVERERERQRALIRLKRDQRRVRQEEDFDLAARLLGIAESSANKLVRHQEDERLRQEKLAQQRLEMARKRCKKGVELTQEEDSDVDLDVDDKTLVETVLKLMDQRHALERNYFIKLLDEEVTDAETLDELSKEDIESRLASLGELRESWRRTEDDSSPEQQTAIFQEAIRLGMELKKRKLEESGLPNSTEDCKVSLLTDLQQCQDLDVDDLMSDMENKDTESLKALCEEQIKAKRNGWHDNVATVLQLVGDSATESSKGEVTAEKQVVQALEKKYDALKDKVIIEALMKQMGEAEWKHLSERERQRHVIKMRVEERRLRQEGKMDEVAMLLGQHLQNEQELVKLLGDTRQSQKEQLEERLARRRQLTAEREAEGLSVDEDVLDEIQEKEEKEKPRRINILANLDMQFEEEKAALLSSLTRQTDHLQAERERQLTLARLRRDRKCLQQEEKLDSAFVIFSLGQQHEADRQKSYLQEKERQRRLAQDRLAARRNKKNALIEGDTSKLEQQITEEIKTEDENKVSESVQQSLLDNTDRCHDSEREVLLQLLQTVFDDSKRKKAFKKLSQEDLKTELAKLQREHTKWLTQSQHAVMTKRGPPKLSDVAKRRAQQFKLLTKAMSYRLEVEERFLQAARPDLDEAGVKEELSVSLLADLQQKHKEDVKSIQDMMLQKDDEFLVKFKGVQETSRLEGWFTNLTSVVFSVHEHDIAMAERKLEAEFEKEKQEMLDRVRDQGEDVDVDTMIKDLEAKFADKKQDVLSNLVNERLISEEQSKENEETATSQLIKLADGQTQVSGDKTPEEKISPLNMLQERLAARRQARRRTAENQGGDESRPSTKDSMMSRPSLTRQKTLASFEVTEEEKHATTQRLINQQMHLHSKLIEDQARQEQLLKQRIEARKGKRQSEVSELLNLGERQKTVLVKTKMDERERQKSMLSERVARVKYERTIIPRGSSQSDTFSNQVEEDEHKDEKMEMMAQRMQQKFSQEADQTSTASDSLMDDKARIEMLKERKRQRKMDKEAKATSGEN